MLMNTNKKILITVVIVCALLVVGFFAFSYVNQPKSDVQDNNTTSIQEEIQQENTQDSQVQFGSDSPSVEIETVQEGGLLVCADKCGDGICQESKNKCDSLNCICLEDKQECPQDCK